MAIGSLNLRVSKEDFVNRINTISSKMQILQDVINRYGEAKRNLNQFVEEGDSTYESWIERIDTNILNCKKAWSSLQESKQTLEKTVEQMEGMSGQLRQTVADATEAAKNVITTTLKVESML